MALILKRQTWSWKYAAVTFAITRRGQSAISGGIPGWQHLERAQPGSPLSRIIKSISLAQQKVIRLWKIDPYPPNWLSMTVWSTAVTWPERWGDKGMLRLPPEQTYLADFSLRVRLAQKNLEMLLKEYNTVILPTALSFSTSRMF